MLDRMRKGIEHYLEIKGYEILFATDCSLDEQLLVWYFCFDPEAYQEVVLFATNDRGVETPDRGAYEYRMQYFLTKSLDSDNDIPLNVEIRLDRLDLIVINNDRGMIKHVVNVTPGDEEE